MTSGRQQAEHNFATFTAWVASRTDDDFRAITHRGILSRKEIAIECGFARSVLDQNPRIKEAMLDLERELRLRNVLPPSVDRDPAAPSEPLVREPGRLRAAQETERLRRLEQENAKGRSGRTEARRREVHRAARRIGSHRQGAPLSVEQILRVTNIRSQDPRGFGGCIFSAKAIDGQGRVQDASDYVVVKATAAALGGTRVEPGQWWKVAGEPSKRLLAVDGYKVTETPERVNDFAAPCVMNLRCKVRVFSV